MGQWVADTIKDWEVQLVVTTNGRIVNAIDTLDIKNAIRNAFLTS